MQTRFTDGSDGDSTTKGTEYRYRVGLVRGPARAFWLSESDCAWRGWLYSEPG
jgi:hypothetical protein